VPNPIRHPGTPAPAASALLSRIGRLDFVGRGMALTVLARLPSMAKAVDDAVRYAAEMSTTIATERPPAPVPQPPDPAIEELQNEFPGWEITNGMLDLVFAEHRESGKRVHGEDTTDLRDAMRAVEQRRDWTA
jgi:hypothetical protein